MCGILGFIGDIPQELQRDAWLLTANIFRNSKIRGEDATGFSAVFHDSSELITEKRAIKSTKFVKRSLKFKTLKKKMPNIFIGHTRATTSGSADRGRNNHPFNNDKYSLIHNGTLRDWKKLLSEISIRSETDSEIILRLLEKDDSPVDGIQRVINTVDTASSMAVAFIKHDAPDKELFIFRNSGRPCYVMIAPEFNAVWFASTKQILLFSVKQTFGTFTGARDKFNLSVKEVPPMKLLHMGFQDGKPRLFDAIKINPQGYGTKTTAMTVWPPRDAVPDTVIQSVSKHSTELLKTASPVSEKKFLALREAAETSGTILKLIRDQKYMTDEEIKDYRKWRMLV